MVIIIIIIIIIPHHYYYYYQTTEEEVARAKTQLKANYINTISSVAGANDVSIQSR